MLLLCVLTQCRRAADLLTNKHVVHAVFDLSLRPSDAGFLQQLENYLEGGHAIRRRTDGSPSSCSKDVQKRLDLPRIRIGERLLSFDEMQTLEDRGELDALLLGSTTPVVIVS